MDPITCVMPVLANWDLTVAAVSDLLAQSVPTRVLIVNQAGDDELRSQLEQLAEEESERVLVWTHAPTLPSLAATWNRCLAFVWATGGDVALVANNDIRCHTETVETLRDVMDSTDALFVSAVGVTGEQFAASKDSACLFLTASSLTTDLQVPIAPGGPDFSCFLISRECHGRFPFDEELTPAFLEDLDIHRRVMLAGEGSRIFSINLPFHHIGGGSQTLKRADPAKRAALEKAISEGSRAHYRAKWGGGANEERYTMPFDPRSAQDGVTTPELQRQVQGATT